MAYKRLKVKPVFTKFKVFPSLFIADARSCYSYVISILRLSIIAYQVTYYKYCKLLNMHVFVNYI